MSDDLGPNKARLYEVCAQAKPGDVLVDLGVRFGVSSGVMLDATQDAGCEVIGVDIGDCPFDQPRRYTYVKGDSVSAAGLIPAPLYLVFFDTIHVKEQVMAELFHYWPKIRVGGWAVFHDTAWTPGMEDRFLGKTWEPPMAGVQAFFAGAQFLHNIQGNPHVAFMHYSESWGMTFVQKLDDWMPEVEGMEQALADSKRLTESLLK